MKSIHLKTINIEHVAIKTISFESNEDMKEDSDTYIQNGLVRHWDAIDKGTDNTIWPDLIVGDILNIRNISGVKENYIQSYLSNNSTVYDIPLYAGTIELCFTDTNTFPTRNELRLHPNCFYIWFDTGNKYGYHSLNVYNKLRARNYINIYNNSSTARCLSILDDKIIYNKQSVIGTAINTSSTGSSKGFEYFASYDTSYNKFHSIRIYDRVLTDEEIMHNQDIDIKRFNLNIPAAVTTLNVAEEAIDSNEIVQQEDVKTKTSSKPITLKLV